MPDNTRSDNAQQEPVRLDKWLWAARFFKTRNLASEAIAGGKVHLNGQRAKPGKQIRMGAHIRIRKGSLQWVIVVCGLSQRRGPASEAVLLYEETEESKELRHAQLEKHRREGAHRPPTPGRPNKKERRLIQHLKMRDR